MEAGLLLGNVSVTDGSVCIGLLGDSGLFKPEESAILVVAVIGKCGIAIDRGEEFCCDTPVVGEISLVGTVEFSDKKQTQLNYKHL